MVVGDALGRGPTGGGGIAVVERSLCDVALISQPPGDNGNAFNGVFASSEKVHVAHREGEEKKEK